MNQYIDLSYKIEEGIPVYPGDDPLKLARNRFLDQDSYNDSKLEMSMHIGTHMDVASHLSKREVWVSDYSPDKFIGNGCLLDVRGEKLITMKEIYRKNIQADDIVILHTGWDKEFDKESYFEHHPVIDKELAKFLIERKVKMVGMDLPSPDYYPFEIHKMLLNNDILIIENMTNLEGLLLGKKFEVIAFPVKIKAEGAPVRVVARVYK